MTGTLSGIVPVASNDTAAIVVTATDAHGEHVSGTMNLSYSGPPAPVAAVAAAVVSTTPAAAAQSASDAPSTLFTVPSSSIVSTSDSSSTGSSSSINTQASGTGAQSPLASSSSGTPGTFQAPQSAAATITAPSSTPTLTAASTDGFQIAVVKGTTTGGGDLSVVKPDVEVQPSSNGSISYSIGVDTFAHTDATASVHLTATLEDGSPLPSWLVFNARTGALSGTPPAGEKRTVVDVRVTAADNEGHQATAEVKIDLKAAVPGKGAHQGSPGTNDHHAAVDIHRTPVVLKDISTARLHVAVRPGLSAQIRSAHRGVQLARDAALLRAAARMVRSG